MVEPSLSADRELEFLLSDVLSGVPDFCVPGLSPFFPFSSPHRPSLPGSLPPPSPSGRSERDYTPVVYHTQVVRRHSGDFAGGALPRL